jgi:hypothetical protein
MTAVDLNNGSHHPKLAMESVRRTQSCEGASMHHGKHSQRAHPPLGSILRTWGAAGQSGSHRSNGLQYMVRTA